MISYYDNIGAACLHSDPPPKGYTVDIVEKFDEPGIVYLRIYAVEIHARSDRHAEIFAFWLKTMLYKLNQSLSIGKYTYEISMQVPQ
jgi:hypothetical protein